MHINDFKIAFEKQNIDEMFSVIDNSIVYKIGKTIVQ